MRAGGGGHLAIQMARVLEAGGVISSGSKPDSVALAKKFGADHVFNYRTEIRPLWSTRKSHGQTQEYLNLASCLSWKQCSLSIVLPYNLRTQSAGSAFKLANVIDQQTPV
jgi:threonine dehydrogenase-like Zn-dependent dehydrogenase